MAEDTLSVLKSIDLSLKTLVVIAQKKAEARVIQSAAKPGPTVAGDFDLDGQYGDPPVLFNPRDWTGEPVKGMHFSQCPAEALDMLAEAYDYFAAKAYEEGDEKKSGYKRKDAARARGWAKRVREGHTTPKPAAPAGWTEPKDDEEVPF